MTRSNSDNLRMARLGLQSVNDKRRNAENRVRATVRPL